MSTDESADRVAQFKKMVEADPQNAMGHLGLGKALLESGAAEHAVEPLSQALSLNPGLIAALELLAEAYGATGEEAKAIDTLQQAYEKAAERGDKDTASRIRDKLADKGVTVAVEEQPDSAVEQAQFVCRRCGSKNGQLESPPMNDALGREVQQKTCSNCWNEWMIVSVKVINELGLNLIHPEARKILDQHMREFLNI